MRNLYQELAQYYNRNLDLVKARCEIATIELAWLWEKYKDDPIEFYRDTDLYIFNLTYYQSKLQENKIHNWYQYMIEKHNWKTGLDYGGGIGEQTILAMEKGVGMIYTEIQDSRTLEYARWRFNKHGFIPQINYEGYLIQEDFDFINAMDILEHIKNPEPVIKMFYKHTEWLFCNPEQIKFNEWVPQHISKFDLTKYFKHIDLYLWKRKRRKEVK
jgi:hypothetical protein